MKKVLFLISAGLIFYSCSASTDSRYEKEKEKPEVKKDVPVQKDAEVKIVEDFDFSPYRTELNIPGKKVSIPVFIPKSEIWYGYEETEDDTTAVVIRKVIDKAQGYRVLLLITDNLEEANNMKSEILFNNIRREVYVIFDPPFYKVMVGDFIEYSEAKDLSFKMNQLGYTEVRVVNETVNIFE